MERVFDRAIAIALVLLTATLAASAQSRTRSVATSGEDAPSGGKFLLTNARIAEKGLPTIAGSTIAFGSDVSFNGQTVYGVYAETNGVLRLVARTGAPSPSGGTILDIVHFAVDRLGNVFVLARTIDGTTPNVLLKYSFPVESAILRVGDALPNGKTIASIGLSVAPDGIGGAFVQVGTSSTPGSFDAAIVRAKGDFMSTKSIVAETGGPAPSGGTFSSISAATLTSSTSGLVAFTATVNGGPGGIVSGLAGNLVLAADASDASANLTIADNDDAEISFMQPSSPGIKMTTLTGTSVFVSNGTAAPRSAGSINFGAFLVGMSADREGSLYFFAPISGDPMRGAGLFRRDRFTNTVTSVALQNDPASGDVTGVYGIFALASNRPARIANDDGKVVFAASAGVVSGVVAIFTTLGAPDGLVPSVASAAVKGAKLVVIGASFEPGAKILVNGTPLADTKNNKKTPTSKLTSKSGSSVIAPGATVSISVRNVTGAVSTPISYTRPR